MDLESRRCNPCVDRSSFHLVYLGRIRLKPWRLIKRLSTLEDRTP